MTVIYIILAAFIAWIWIDYFRLIEIYNKTDLLSILITFSLGCASVMIVFGMDDLLKFTGFSLNGNILNDFLYSVFNIGYIEEFAKAVPFILAYLLFRKHFNEPIDYLAFICVSALGFSAVENVQYFIEDGAKAITLRAIQASIGHMFYASLTAYGVILVKFRHKKNRVLILLGYFSLAAACHGFYDFWLVNKGLQGIGWIVSTLFFMLNISIFATILNNALNNSSFFSYKRVIESGRVASRLLLYYGIVLAAQLVILLFQLPAVTALVFMIFSVKTVGAIVIIGCIRLSRFKLIEGRWQKIKIEFPFTISGSSAGGLPGAPIGLVNISIKGESYDESVVNAFYEEYFYLRPVSGRNSELDDDQLSYIEKKIFLKNDESFYVGKLFTDSSKESYESCLFKPKTDGMTMMYDKYPIVAILKYSDAEQLSNTRLSAKSFEFQEWGYIVPEQKDNENS